NGPEGDYTSPGGLAGRCKARLKDKTIIIEAVALAHPEPTTTVRMRTKERWQLSRDAKILTIKSDADFTDFPTDISGIVAGNTTTKYTRVENP
ncbi:MAG TPA: hypothetical protein VM715_15580, partial [Candidatus Acidoferrum sp.]|nr:hypothetical protein [Candidatus Acidoferrum sp.]